MLYFYANFYGMKNILFVLVAIAMLGSCKTSSKTGETSKSDTYAVFYDVPTQLQEPPVVDNIPFVEDLKQYTITPVVENLTNPWGMCWLPNKDLIYTEKDGTMYRYDGAKSYEISGVPDVYTRGQGGLLDVIAHPDFTKNSFIYISYASPAGDDDGAHSAVARAVLKNDRLENLEVLYKATPNTKKGIHFGSRFAWDKDGYLYFTMGERGERDENPQDISRDGGKVYRIHDDGRIPADNPFVKTANALTAIYTFGNRNPQGMTTHPKTGIILAHEHGPQGGDEINIIKAGLNYGWPIISYGEEYGGGEFAVNTQYKGMAQPIYQWTPSIAPSGFAIIDNPAYGDWDGNYLVGSLKFQYLEMLYVKDLKVIKREKLVDQIGRLRNVKMGPDGIIYIGVEGKGIFKITRN